MAEAGYGQEVKKTDDRPWTVSPASTDQSRVEEVSKELGRRIRRRRKEVGWSQEELALIAEIDRSYVGGIERGDRNISFTMLCRLCQALKCDVGSLTAGLPANTG